VKKTVIVGAGKYRVVTQCGGIAEKRLHPSRNKSYLGVQISYPMRWYTFKFLTRNMNLDDLRHYQRFFGSVPEHLAPCFARIVGVQKKGREWVLQQELVRDFDGTVSRSLEESGPVLSPFFWKRFDEIMDFLTRNRVPLLDLRSSNVLVKRLGGDKSIPVLFDFKRMSARYYPAQPWIWTKKGQQKRLLRRAAAIRRSFGPKQLPNRST
jgi:hypothetical protein